MPNDFSPRQPIVGIPFAFSKIQLAELEGLRFNLSPMESSSEYLIISGSLRSKSRSRAMANFLSDCYRSEGIMAEMIDLRGLPLPFCDGESAYDHQSVATLSRAISSKVR